MQSYVDRKAKFHVAVIMDGNGRWATRRGLPRSAGHQAGVRAARRISQAAPDLGVDDAHAVRVLVRQLAAPSAEVNALMSLLAALPRLRARAPDRERNTAHGHRPARPVADRLEAPRSNKQNEGSTKGRRLNLRIAIDYSSRDAIVDTALRWLRRSGAITRGLSAACSPRKEPTQPTSIFLSAPAARSACRISCCGNAPTPSFASSTPCGPTSTARRSGRGHRRFRPPRTPLRRTAERRGARCRRMTAMN